ncbi:MAG: M23 family metallopeptidase [Pyrinomonadaceae bacterium]
MALYFPAPKWVGSYVEMAKFGHRRKSGARIHAGCDLYAPLESDVVAVDGGIVVELNPGFSGHTAAIAIRHEGIGVIRYGEVIKITEEYNKVGAKIKSGERVVIAKIGRAVAKLSPMLHFELYDGFGVGPLSDRVHKIEYKNEDVLKDANYERRADLMNPTKFLERLWLEGIK